MISARRFYLSSIGLSLLVLGAADYASAQSFIPRPSSRATVMQTIGVTDVTITYSRPGVKGRKIWGDALPSQTAAGEATLDNQNLRPKDAVIVPWGHAWRTGANEATQFVVTDDVLINGQKLPAGSYSLHTIPNKDEWTIIFNSEANQWGSFNYNAAKDTLRVKAKPQWVEDNQEWLMYSFEVVTDDSAQVNICWEKLRVPFTVKIPNVEALWRWKVDAAIAANPTDWRLLFQVANFYNEQERWSEAIAWIDKSIAVQPSFENLRAKASSLLSAGRKQEAVEVANRAIARGKADKKDTASLEKLVANDSTTSRILTREAPTLSPVVAVGRYYALVIGNDRYQYVPGLKMAEADARAVAVLLQDRYGFSTKLLLNATRQDIISSISNYRRTLDANDSFLVYYAGHGYYDREVDRAYWLPTDARREDNSNWISADDITGNVKGVGAKHVLIVSDSCYSGTISRDVIMGAAEPAGRSRFLQKMLEGKSRTLMASGGNEPVSDGGGGKHSVFARAFLTGLEQFDKNAFTANELFRDFVQERVAGGAKQTPEYSPLRNSGHESGDFVFVRR